MTNTRLTLSDFIPYWLSVVSNEVSASIAQLYQQRFGINMHQWRVMAILGEESELSAGEVADRTAMDKVAVSRAVKRLLDQGLISREFAEQDRRRSILKLSNDGWAIYQQIVPMARAYEKSLLEQLSTEERSQLTNLLTKLRKANSQLKNGVAQT